MKSLKQLRLEAGLSRSEIYMLLNIPYRTVQNWETGKSTPPIYVKLLYTKFLMDYKKGR